MKIGFIGLGIMGRPMAGNLLKAGHSLFIIAGRGAADELSSLGAKEVAEPADAAREADIVITMLPDSPDVRHVALGPGGIIEAAAPGKVLIDMSSIAPLVSREIAECLAARGMGMLDAPVSGGEPKAVDGTIAVMAGGDRKLFDSCYEIMTSMAGSVTHVGEIGAGNTAKLCNQVIVALNISALSEALVLAKKSGVNPELVYKAIRGGLAGSAVMDAKAPMMLEGNFEPGFRIDLHIKDLANALETSGEVGAPLPLAAQAMEIMKAVRQDGGGIEDHAGLIKFYERLSSTRVSPDS